MPKPFHNFTFEGTCQDLTYEGKGVVLCKEGPVFVSGVLPGEKGLFEVTYRRNGVLFGRIRRLDSLSKDRIEPRCHIATSCGGCCFQQYAYPAQLLFKQKTVKEQFRKIAKMNVEVKPTLGMKEPYYYRNKIQMPFVKDKRGGICYGFYRENTHEVIPVDTCYIEDERATPILKAIKKLLKSFRLDPYDEDRRTGILRHVLIRTSYYKEEVMVVLVTNVDSFPSRNNFVKALVTECPNITTVVQNINSRHTNVILGEKERVLYGPGFIEDSLCGLTFRISAKSFYQTNPVMTEVLYEEAMKAASLTGEEVVLDAYSGIGTIGMVASKKAKMVISVEIVKSAVRDARRNALTNKINNIDIYEGDASDFMVDLANKNESIDVLFMDPPRKGSDERFLEAALKLKPKRIVYISCNCSTLARDVAYLGDKYRIESLQPVDLFPMTAHVETVCLLSQRKQKAVAGK